MNATTTWRPDYEAACRDRPLSGSGSLRTYHVSLSSICGPRGLPLAPDPSWARRNRPLLLSAALGFYLLTCAYTAIGLFMSSLTSYQIISAIGTFAVIFILSRIGGLWQKIDFVRDLTYFLYLSGRTAKMLTGLIASKDLI